VPQEKGPSEGMSLRRTPQYRNLHACKQLSFYRNVGIYKNRRIYPGITP